MPIIYSSEYCKFYPYCIHSNFKEISCKNGNWIYCYIYQKINISKMNNMNNKSIRKFSLCDNCLDKNICLLYERELLPKDYRCLRNPRKIRKNEFLSKLFNEFLND